MGRRRRLEEPDRYYLLSNRVAEGEFLLRPDEECCRIARSCLAREARRKGVLLVAYVFISNHFHLVAGFPEANMSAFMRDFQRSLSSRIKTLRNDRSAPVFDKRYHDKVILDPDELLDDISYTVNNAVRHGLVTHAGHWPGVGSLENIRDRKPLVGRWLDPDKWHNLSRRKNPPPREEAMVEKRVELHIPVRLPGDNEEERRAAMLQRIEADRERFCKEAGIERRLRPDDPARFRSMDWRTRRDIDEKWCSRRRICSGSDREAVEEYREERRAIEERYRQAADRWKAGRSASFPEGTYPPGRAEPVMEKVPRAPPTR